MFRELTVNVRSSNEYAVNGRHELHGVRFESQQSIIVAISRIARGVGCKGRLVFGTVEMVRWSFPYNPVGD